MNSVKAVKFQLPAREKIRLSSVEIRR